MTRDEKLEVLLQASRQLRTLTKHGCVVVARSLIEEVVEALEAEKPLAKEPLPVDENCIAAFDVWMSPATYALLKRDGHIAGGFVLRTYPGGSRVHVIFLAPEGKP